MAAVSDILRTLPKLPPEQQRTLDTMDEAFKKQNEDGSSIDERGRVANIGAGVLFCKVAEQNLFIALGQLKKKDARNGMYASFSGGAEVKDFSGPSASPVFATACRELGEELGPLIPLSTFREAVDQPTTVVGVNKGFPHFVNPIFLVKSTDEINDAIETSFKETKEIKRIRWVDAKTIIESAEAVQIIYDALCKTFIEENAERLKEQWGPNLSDQEFKDRLNKEIRNDPRLKAARDGVVIGRAQGGSVVQIAPYSARSILELRDFFPFPK